MAISRVRDAHILVSVAPEKTKKVYQDEYLKEAKDIAGNLSSSSAYPDLRDVTESMYGTWYTTCDRNLIAYSLLAENDLKSMKAYQIIKEMQNESYRECPKLTQQPDSISNINEVKDALQIIITNHNNNQGGKSDALSKAQEQVE